MSELLGEKVFTVRQWRMRENIPSAYWDSLSRLDAVGDRLAFLDRLARLASARADAPKTEEPAHVA
ncbi:MAG: hypothetical protein AAFR28_18145 [Pseudomonadota bacterium]